MHLRGTLGFYKDISFSGTLPSYKYLEDNDSLEHSKFSPYQHAHKRQILSSTGSLVLFVLLRAFNTLPSFNNLSVPTRSPSSRPCKYQHALLLQGILTRRHAFPLRDFNQSDTLTFCNIFFSPACFWYPEHFPSYGTLNIDKHISLAGTLLSRVLLPISGALSSRSILPPTDTLSSCNTLSSVGPLSSYGIFKHTGPLSSYIIFMPQRLAFLSQHSCTHPTRSTPTVFFLSGDTLTDYDKLHSSARSQITTNCTHRLTH